MPVPESTQNVSNEAPPRRGPRPELRVVPADREFDRDAERDSEVPRGETARAGGRPIEPLAPLDVRVWERILALAKRFLDGKPDSFSESLEYSRRGDWATSESPVKRGIHTGATVLAFGLTAWMDVVLAYRSKPTGFVLFLVLAGLALYIVF